MEKLNAANKMPRTKWTIHNNNQFTQMKAEIASLVTNIQEALGLIAGCL